MKIQIGNLVREMTPDEEQVYVFHEEMPQQALTRYANELTGADDPDLLSAAETLIKQRKNL